MSDLEAKLRTELDVASRQVSGDGPSRASIDQRLRQRSDQRRRRRRTVGALGAGLFVVLVVGAAVGLAQNQDSRTAGQPEDFGPFCAVADRVQNGGNDVTGLTQKQADAKSSQILSSLRDAAPESLKPSFDDLQNRPSTQAEAKAAPELLEKSIAAGRTIDEVLRSRCRLTAVLGQTLRVSPGAPDDSKHTATGSCLEGPGWSVCLEGLTGELRFKAAGLQPGSLIAIKGLLLDGSPDPMPVVGVVGTDGSFSPDGPAWGRLSNAVRVSHEITFTPAGGTERTQVLNA